MGRSVNDGTPAYAQIDFLERRNAKLENEVERLKVIVEKRGLPIDVFNDCERLTADNKRLRARMQIMREILISQVGPSIEDGDFYPEIATWFDDDGAPK